MSNDSLDDYIEQIKVLDYNLKDSQQYEKVYKPNDDSFLLYEGIKKDIYKIMEMDPHFVLEIG